MSKVRVSRGVTIVSLNAWGGRVGSALVDWIRDIDADVYCLQEMFSAPSLQPPYLTDEDGHRVHLDLYRELHRVLPLYRGFFSPGSRGYVNDSQWTGLQLEYGLAVFVRHSISVVAFRADIVYGSFRRDGTGRPPLSRCAQILRCCTPDGFLTIGHIHGLWDPAGKHDTPARLTQARTFGALIDSIAAPGDAVLACGDFNLLPGSATFDKMGQTRWRNLVVELGVSSTRSALYIKPTRFADYMLTNKHVEVLHFEVPQKPIVSDHCPLLLEAGVGR